MKGIAIAIVCLLLAMVAAVAIDQAAAGRILVNAQLTEQTGSTQALGGGDYLFVRFGTDAAFGVVYGNATNPNDVYLVAMKARYLGVAQVYDQAGKQISSNRPVKIFTIYAMKLDDIVEFKDNNGNGLADYGRSYNGTDFTGYQPTDTFYKKVSLRTSWTRGAIARANSTDWRSWTFNVSATNLPYTVPANFSGAGTGSLPLVRFTFHLNASLEQLTNATVPQWKVTVGTLAGRYYITDLSRLQNLTVSGKVVHYDLKWDQEIQGWSYDKKNNNARLLLEFHAMVGNLVPQVIADAWIENRAVSRAGEDGTVKYNTTTGIRTANDTTGGYPQVQALRSPYLDFEGSWTRIGRLDWVTNSTVDGSTQPLYGQVLGGWRMRAIGESGNAFNGFVILAGMSFKGGADIVHDPTVTADVQADLDLPGSLAPFWADIAVIAGIAVAAVLGILLFLFLVVFRRRRSGGPRMPPPPSPPMR